MVKLERAITRIEFGGNMRLDKYLTQSSLGTRKRVHEVLTAGEITVNGTVTRDATMQILPGQAQVRYGKQIGRASCRERV